MIMIHQLRKALVMLLVACLALSVSALAAPEDEAAETAEATGEENAETYVDPYGLNISAECAILVDASTGQVIYERNAEKQHLIASTTKIMTALVVLEKAENLDETVIVQQEWADVEGSSMYLRVGEPVSIRGLLYGLMMNSGNDAATALACAVAGDEATFVEWMNKYAAKFGMNDTHFANPHGLDAEDHYSTAHDMARLMIHAMENADFREITHTRYINIDGYELYFHNKLLDRYEYCIGGKTGYTYAAGRTLVTASEKDGHLLIAVTLNAPDDWNDQIAMYDYGFAHCNSVALCTAGERGPGLNLRGLMVSVPTYYLSSLSCVTMDGAQVQKTVYLPDSLVTDVPKGCVIGRVEFIVDGVLVGTGLLVTGDAINCEGETTQTWKNDFKNTCLLAGLYPDAQPNGTYRIDGLLSTALSPSWG
jgi:serine-type D-Ala-D-Ala carboxypeptidase (penicillin-binding protein 5/6)